MSNAPKNTLKKRLQQEGKIVISNKSSSVNINHIVSYIDKNIVKIQSLEDLAQTFNFSKSYFSHIFKAHTGLSVFQYIKLKRLCLAKKYYESGLSLTEAAAKAGFSDYSAFYKAYRNEFGVSPSKAFNTPDRDYPKFCVKSIQDLQDDI